MRKILLYILVLFTVNTFGQNLAELHKLRQQQVNDARGTYIPPDFTALSGTYSYDLDATATHTQTVSINLVGSKLFVGSSVNLYRYSYNGTNISSSTYDTNTCVLVNTTYALFVRDGMTQTFEVDSGGTIRSYSYSTAGDLTTRSFDTGSDLNLTELDGANAPRDIFIRKDGLKAYILDRDAAVCKIYQYTFGTAWDTSSLTYDSKFFDLAAAESSDGFWITDDGLQLVSVYSDSNGKLKIRPIGTAWDISTAGTISTELTSLSGFYTNPVEVDQVNSLVILGAGGHYRTYAY